MSPSRPSGFRTRLVIMMNVMLEILCDSKIHCCAPNLMSFCVAFLMFLFVINWQQKETLKKQCKNSSNLMHNNEFCCHTESPTWCLSQSQIKSAQWIVETRIDKWEHANSLKWMWGSFEWIKEFWQFDAKPCDIGQGRNSLGQMLVEFVGSCFSHSSDDTTKWEFDPEKEHDSSSLPPFLCCHWRQQKSLSLLTNTITKYTLFWSDKAIVLPSCVESYLVSVLGISANVRG